MMDVVSRDYHGKLRRRAFTSVSYQRCHDHFISVTMLTRQVLFLCIVPHFIVFFFFQAEDGIRDDLVTGVQTCALPIYGCRRSALHRAGMPRARCRMTQMRARFPPSPTTAVPGQAPRVVTCSPPHGGPCPGAGQPLLRSKSHPRTLFGRDLLGYPVWPDAQKEG